MRLILRFALSFFALIVVIISLHEIRQFYERRIEFETDLEVNHQLVASTLAQSVASIVEHAGVDAARRALAEAETKLDGELRIRWVCADVDENSDVDCAVVSRMSGHEARAEPSGGVRLFSWAPVDARGTLGAVEVSESPAHEDAWLHQHINDALRLAVATMVAMMLASALLGWWFVLLPTQLLRAKAKAVGRGELLPDLMLPRDDELGDLAREMNAMCRQIGSAREAAAREASARVTAVERLQHANRLATIGRLASGVAHEVGTPLNVIEVRAGLIVEDHDAPDSVRQSAQVIVQCSENVARMVRQLLTFARPRTLDLTETHLAHVARTVVELIRPLAAQRNVTVSADDLADVTLLCDALLVQQAMVNLVINAVHACDAFGRVTVTVDEVVRGQRRYGHIAVSDNGIGITDEVRAQLWEPFFTTKLTEGTGLGLPIVHSIVEDHGGLIEVDSVPKVGSTFHVFLPCKESV